MSTKAQWTEKAIPLESPTFTLREKVILGTTIPAALLAITVGILTFEALAGHLDGCFLAQLSDLHSIGAYSFAIPGSIVFALDVGYLIKKFCFPKNEEPTVIQINKNLENETTRTETQTTSSEIQAEVRELRSMETLGWVRYTKKHYEQIKKQQRNLKKDFEYLAKHLAEFNEIETAFICKNYEGINFIIAIKDSKKMIFVHSEKDGHEARKKKLGLEWELILNSGNPSHFNSGLEDKIV